MIATAEGCCGRAGSRFVLVFVELNTPPSSHDTVFHFAPFKNSHVHVNTGSENRSQPVLVFAVGSVQRPCWKYRANTNSASQ